MPRQCLNCEVEVKRKKRFAKFCSDRCQRNYNARNSYNYENRKKSYYKNKYNLSLDALDKMVKEQNNKCFICSKVTSLFVDHNHETNQIRKLLCSRCNSILGFCDENPIVLIKAAQYIMEKDYS